MCGVNFIIDWSKNIDQKPIEKMNDTLLHRGDTPPQYQKIITEKANLFAGHVLLKIKNATEKAYQPLFSEDKRYGIVFNGEIYNYKLLQQKFLPEYTKNIFTDTEILLYCLIIKGKKILNFLNGMFAFVFWDIQQKEIIVGRDLSFMKPLFWYKTEKYCVISSEIKGILASGLVDKRLNERQILHYIPYKFAQRPETFWQNIYEVESAFTLNFDTKKSEKILIIYKSLTDTIAQPNLITLLEKAVFEHKETELPLGIFLSGGVDSTLLLALTKKLFNEEIHSFSIGFTQKNTLQDTYFAEKAAKTFGAKHHTLLLNTPTLKQVQEVVHKLDQPIADTAIYLTYFISSLAKKYVKIVFSGAGADEIFAGYRRHKAFEQYLYYKKVILFFKFLKNVLPYQDLQHFFRNIEKDEKQTFLNFTSLKMPFSLKKKWYATQKEFTLQEALAFDKTHFLASDVLKLTDEMSMQHALEVRLPYLDNDLSLFVEKIPAQKKLNPEPKIQLKKLLAQLGGADFAYRKKQGFGVPLAIWFRENKEFLTYLKSRKNSIQNYLPIKDLTKLYQNHALQELWAILVLELWLEHHFT